MLKLPNITGFFLDLLKLQNITCVDFKFCCNRLQPHFAYHYYAYGVPYYATVHTESVLITTSC